MNTIPYRQIRAVYTEDTIRVYQAYSDRIADAALRAGTFVSPPFKMDRMTWIKPSFLWMMYRSGWGTKTGQERILAIDISRDGFEWALNHSCLSHFDQNVYPSYDEWVNIKRNSPVRIQWDPERDFHLRPLEYRSIQIGLSKEAVGLYIEEWTQKVTDVTMLTDEIRKLVEDNKIEKAIFLAPEENGYIVSDKLAKKINLSQ